MKIVCLGWGSLIWDPDEEFDKHHKEWKFDGPKLKIEFSRISCSRDGALTLVIDSQNGEECQMAHTQSTRKNPDDAICDLRCREGTTLSNIGYLFLDGSCKSNTIDKESLSAIEKWASEKKFDVVVWTNLKSNFKEKVGSDFSVEEGQKYFESLLGKAKNSAVKYVKNAPDFVHTPLRRKLDL